MNETVAAEQKQIFEANLESAELETVNALVSKHKANAAVTQQLALDASRLVTSSQERLVKQSEAGFFKRFASAISGRTSENQLLNQMDMLQMQKFAWHYLQQLQQQNLINAQGIAVIRNNLGTMNEYIIETRDFLEQAIDKIDNRLRHVENNTSFNNWSLNIDANKRRLKSIPKILLILRLTYDFMRNHQDVVLTERDISNYLVTTLEKLDINCDEDVRLLDFISELIDQIEVVGIDQYRAVIDLSFDEYTVDSDYIQKNISGIGFNALYFLSDYYEKIVDMIGDDQLCNSDEAREKIISKFFGSEFSDLSTTYSIRNLICEIIGGSQLAIEVYKDEHGLNVGEDEIAEEPQPEPVALVSSLPDIRAHTFLDSDVSAESKRNYLLLLALSVENSAFLSGLAGEFIALLAEKSGFPELQKEIIELADNPRKHKEYLPVMQALLDDDDKKYTWLLDAFFLLTLDQKGIENPQIKAILGALKPTQFKECLPNLRVIIGECDASQVLKAGSKLAIHTQGWKNVIRYRELRFDQCFAEAIERLYSASDAVYELLSNMSDKVYRKGMDHSYGAIDLDDLSLMEKATAKAINSFHVKGRKSALSGLNNFRKKAADFLSENRSTLYQANRLISRWNLPSFEFDDLNTYSDFDLDNSADNEDWDKQFEHYYRQIENPLTSFSQACDDAREQLSLFVEGNFHQSVLELKEQKRLERQRQQELEKQGKQSVTIIMDGKEQLFSIEWQQIENPPCEPNKIVRIKTDGRVWLIVASINSDELIYRSENGMHWQQVQLDAPDIKIWLDGVYIVNGMWIIKNRELREGTREEGFYYSADAITWRHSPAPEPSKRALSINDGHMFFENLLYFNGLWLWLGQQFQKYSSTEKGFFSDSTKSAHYKKIIIYYSKTLDGPWQPWDQTPRLSEGVEVESIYSLPGRNALMAVCQYDSSYVRNKKKPETPPFVMYYGSSKTWRECIWGSSKRFSSYHELVLSQMGDRLMCFHDSEILTSDKGYDWRLQEINNLSAGECLPLKYFSLLTSNYYSHPRIYLTQDAKHFKEIMLEEGTWSYLTANEEGILGVYCANQHEETVLRLGRYPESIRKPEQPTDGYDQTNGVKDGGQNPKEDSSDGKSNIQASGLDKIENTHGSAQITPKSLPYMVQLLLGASLIVGLFPLFQRQNTQEQEVLAAKQATSEVELKAKSAEIEAVYAKKQMVQMEIEHADAHPQRVTDLTGTLTPEQQADFEQRLAALETEKGSQLALLLIPTTQPETIEQFGIRVVDAWKLGRKGVDDGALILFAKQDRTVRIEVRRGLEGVIPDAIAKRVVEETMIPFFKGGDVHGGLSAGIDRLAALVRSEQLPKNNDHSQPDSGTLPADPTPTNEASDHAFDNIFNAAKFWTSEWGNDIRAAMSKGPCKSADLITNGYEYRGYASIPISRLKNANEAWYTFDDRAVTVVGCWIHHGDGHASYKMVRKKDNKVLEGDMNFGDGSWEVTYKELEQ